jgi:glutaconate CoA-transferase, subunit A
MKGRVMSLPEAASLVREGDRLVLSGSMDFSPMALVREIVKQGTGNLHLISSASAAVNADLLIGAGAVASVEFPQIAFGEYGLAPHFRQAVESGRIEYRDHV